MVSVATSCPLVKEEFDDRHSAEKLSHLRQYKDGGTCDFVAILFHKFRNDDLGNKSE